MWRFPGRSSESKQSAIPASIATRADRRIVGRRSARQRRWLVVVPTAADGVADCTEESQNEANNQHDDTDRPKDRDTRDESDNKEGKTENDQRISCSADESRAMLHCSQETSLNVRPPMLCARTIADHDRRIGAPSPDPAVWTVGPRVGKNTPREQINDQMTRVREA